MLIIVESPAKAKTISAILAKTKSDTKYIVKASVGHIRSLSKANKNAKGEKLEISGIDIASSFAPIFEIDPEKKLVVSELKKLAKESKDGILFATDCDREGEAISWHLAEVLGVPKDKVKRLEFHEITESAIMNAIKNPRPLDVNLVAAQQARQVLDKLVGFKLSPVLWQVLGDYHLSAGRVQSPALRLISEREIEIQKFESKEFWEIEGVFAKTEKDKAGTSKNSNSGNSQNQKDVENWQKMIAKFEDLVKI